MKSKLDQFMIGVEGFWSLPVIANRLSFCSVMVELQPTRYLIYLIYVSPSWSEIVKDSKRKQDSFKQETITSENRGQRPNIFGQDEWMVTSAHVCCCLNMRSLPSQQIAGVKPLKEEDSIDKLRRDPGHYASFSPSGWWMRSRACPFRPTRQHGESGTGINQLKVIS